PLTRRLNQCSAQALLKKSLNQLVQKLFLSGLCVVLQQDWHERQRYEKQTDRLWQTVVSKTKAYRNCTDVRLAGVPDRSGPGRPFGDFSDGAEKSLGPEAETLHRSSKDDKIPGMLSMPGIF
ncbi:MAG: hypothetical protein II111_01835, partial [Oscillospiraceae bacterium]|nr:hypothetical protein [Oscillospiraceae bacterium]